jgi:glutamine---fructose-6-phosphate transaminase (isomerizing)
MFREAASAAAAVRVQLEDDASRIANLAADIRRFAPRAVITCARGSSDHAASYAKYLIEMQTGILTASAAPSVNSIYGVAQNLCDCLFIAISQSGRSPDVLASVASAKASGARVLAVCNTEDAPLVRAADDVILLRAGTETSVAATKSFLATLASLAQLVAEWTLDKTFHAALRELPALMDLAWQLDWTEAVGLLENKEHLYVIGRGLGLCAAQEIALKCKETCGLHAEAYSSAELRHGPLALLGRDFPALLLAQRDAARPGIESLAAELANRGIPVMLAGGAAAGPVLDLPSIDCAAEIAPLLLTLSAYRMIATLALRRGFDPDRPAHLSKVTETM